MSRDFRKLLFEVSEALVTDELSALKFLSLEHVPRRKLEAIQEPKAFFEVLQEKDMIGVGNLSLLKELLYRIGRIDLLTAHLGSSREEMERELQLPGRAQVSAYRQLLYGIAEDLTPEDVRSVKFLLQKQLPKNKLQENASMLQVFLEMEINGIIKEDNLTMLKDILQGFRADLKKKIDAYEEKRKENYSREEVRYPVSVSAHPEEQRAEGEAPHPYGKIYKMKNNPHGYCLILNNHIFKNPRYNREGTLQDGEAVKEVFKWLQFETVEYMDLEGKKLKDTVKEYSKKDHRNMDCFVCFILSHGEKDKIKGVDDVCVNIEDLVSCFTGTNCPSLAGKPKVFIIQACQGSLGHPSVTVEPDSSGHLEVDATPSTSIPDKADILIGMATVEDYLSFRSRRTGSVYIQSLCEKMKLLCPLGVDFTAILTEVNNEVAGKELEGCKQMPKITSTLLKQLIFEIPQRKVDN
ncbi:caspase-8 [Corvus cornix cornix]|uniref:caspase-8 n=1 Tax=Corvus cornix cornix TaxID=932674 RepID=UPI0005344A93|nr:caspase-8 [Corvus cornix cornix]XP_039410712.1 caspase-8 [Corvus cornix cornix]XP_048165086.1 caspase-8-like [Corvus hawaiiensis]XP_048165087.1 caspase-8-like [Corvus hawaiiensis]XP_048165088.1 caspase-8-like [Corvus hawaiiensis]